jgi:hypothetical protein
MIRWLAALLMGGLSGGALGATISFDLLAWDDSQATPEHPSAVGVKPSQVYPTQGDWLVFTDDDEQLPESHNPAGAVSHTFVDITGIGGAGFNRVPSLFGDDALTTEITCAKPGSWDVQITGLGYTGQADSVMQMNQFLVSPGSPATEDPTYNVDGLGNSGVWSASATNNWTISYELDFYLATNADGDPDPADIDATFNNKLQTGYLIPVDELTPEGMNAVTFDDPAGFFNGDFESYLLDQIAPRLPHDATYLLVTQMDKLHPDYAEVGLPLTTGSLVGNTTIAFTTHIPLGGGDADGDGDVDLEDFTVFADCMAGAAALPEPPPPMAPGECLCAFDFDDDGDVDLTDFAVFQEMFSG